MSCEELCGHDIHCLKSFAAETGCFKAHRIHGDACEDFDRPENRGLELTGAERFFTESSIRRGR